MLTYLHADHLGSTLLATDSTGNVVGDNQPRYYAYGRERIPSLAALPTDYTFTGQKQDGSGLVYMHARYYDPQTGQFISPDSLVPDATNLVDYNRYAYGRDNPLKYNDPSGHCVTTVLGVGADVATGGAAILLTGVEIGVDAACWVAVTEAAYLVTNLVLTWGDKTDAMLNLAEKSANASQQNTGGQNAGNSSTGNPNDPEDPFGFNRFSKLVRDKGFESLQKDLQSPSERVRTGAQRVVNVMERLGNNVQRVGVQYQVGQQSRSDIDILDAHGNVYEVTGPGKDPGILGNQLKSLQMWVQQSSNPNAKVYLYYFGQAPDNIRKIAERWGTILVEATQ